MEEQDLEPRNRRPKPKDLASMSIAGLHDYIAELEVEIVRARTAIDAKQSWRGTAENFFRE